jgi:hypothetical protein
LLHVPAVHVSPLQQRSPSAPHVAQSAPVHRRLAPVQLSFAQHVWPAAPQSPQCPFKVQPSPALQVFPLQQTSPAAPHWLQRSLLHPRPVPQVFPAQHVCPAPPHAAHVRPPAHAKPVEHVSPAQHG